MTKQLSIIFLLISISAFSQIKFREGYFVTNKDQRKNVLIKDIDWKNYPDKFLYKETPDSDTKQETIANVKEFSVNNTKFVRFDVLVDNSSDDFNNMDGNKDPKWIAKTTFLKLLVDGDTKLYKYSQNGNEKYFIKKTIDSDVQQLVFKRYLSEQQNLSVVKSNNEYKKQLESINSAIPTSDLKYEQKALVKWFNQNSGNIEVNNNSNDSGKFNIHAKIGFLSSKYQYQSSATNENFNLGRQTTLSPSLEFEYILNFNKSKWSIFAEPIYSSYSGNVTTEKIVYITFINKYTYNVDYRSIILPMGIKHYLFVSNKSKFFISGAFVVSIPLDYTINFYSDTNQIYSDEPNSTGAGFQVGIGYTFNNKWSLEGRLINQSSGISNSSKGKMNSLGLSIGYNIF